MSKSFYRFRSVEALIGDYEELDKQSIYFARPEQLNDPMEGFRNIYWSGDNIVWKNFIRHYLFCLERSCSLFILSGDTYSLSGGDLPIYADINKNPNIVHQELFLDVCTDYFESKSIEQYIKRISDRTTPIHRDELLFYLSTLHGFAIEVIFNRYEKRGLIPKRQEKSFSSLELIDNMLEKDFIGVLEKVIGEHKGINTLTQALFNAQRHTSSQVDLIFKSNDTSSIHTANQAFILNDFPEKYINQVEQLLYPEWYTACFMSECSNSSVWGHYGSNHTGICLKFKSESIEKNDYITLKSATSSGSINLKFEPINYKEKFVEIDFFRSLGRLNKETLEGTWYTNEEGERSDCACEIFNSEESWRKRYWDSFLNGIKVKSKDWEYENEHRLILSSPLGSYTEQEHRTLEYAFESLEGLIFGIKTSIEDKLKIIETISKKCEDENRNDFKFYQAYFCHASNCINYAEMSLIKFQNDFEIN